MGQWEAPHVWQTLVIITALPLKPSRSFYILQVIVWLSSDFKPSMTTANGNPIQRNPIEIGGHWNNARLSVDGRVSFCHLNQSIVWLLKPPDGSKAEVAHPSQRVISNCTANQMASLCSGSVCPRLNQFLCTFRGKTDMQLK